MSDYVAGSCNIGSAEIHRRYQVAILGSVVYLALTIYIVASDAPTLLRFLAFAPAMVASVGFNQARRKFCLAYGLMGVFNFNAGNNVSKVLDPVALAADRAYALKILAISFLPALLMTAVPFSL
jgi:hypothetical protein